MVMLSDFLRFRVLEDKRATARAVDLILDLAAGDYPPVIHLLIKDRSGHTRSLEWGQVVSIDWRQRRIFVKDVRSGRAAPEAALTRSVLAKRDILDALVGGVTITEFADVGAALELFGISKFIAVPISAIVLWYVVVARSYTRVEKLFLLLTPVASGRADWHDDHTIYAVVTTKRHRREGSRPRRLRAGATGRLCRIDCRQRHRCVHHHPHRRDITCSRRKGDPDRTGCGSGTPTDRR